MRPRFGCDNLGVVRHGNSAYRPLPSQQSQADVLRYYKKLVRAQPFKSKMYHVHGHLDELLDLSELSPAELANVECDYLASVSLSEALQEGRFIESIFPHEDIVVMVGGDKVTGALTPVITRTWGDEAAREHYHIKNIIHRDNFDLVYWDGLEKVMNSAPEMWSVWVTKQVSGFCGTNHMLRNFQDGVVDQCPNCLCTPERATHIFNCRDPARSQIYEDSVDILITWLSSQQTDPALLSLISTYLRCRGDRTMTSLCSPGSRYFHFAVIQDKLGFRNFIEGRVPAILVGLRSDYIAQNGLRRHAGHWCNGLILRLLQIIHRQWTFRNGTVHYRGPDGMTMTQQRQLAQKCEDLLWTDPMTLLDDDRALLDIDFSTLGAGPSSNRQLWVSEMEAARCAAQYKRRGTAGQGVSVLSEQPDPTIDTEGSIRFRRRRRRMKGH